MKFSGKRVLVIGAARSGIACARFLLKRGATIALNDRNPLERWPHEATELGSKGVGCIPGDPPSWLLDQMDLVVISPGVPAKSVHVRYAERRGIEVIGEIELASRFLHGRLIAITGTNGKTTTTTLVGKLLSDAGITVQVGGNIGTPLISLVDTSRKDGWNVAEVSSFQLETIVHFRPSIAIVLNVTPNHMDRYSSFNEYAAAKHRIFENQDSSDIAILSADDPVVDSWSEGLRAKVIKFSTRHEVDKGLFLTNRGELVSRSDAGETVLSNRSEMQLRGQHNIENALAALAAGLACGARPDSLRETLKRFEPVEHRLESVAEIDGIRFYNDSKATSVDAALKALEAFDNEDGKIIMIMGGRGKQAPYAPLKDLVSRIVRKLILIGEDAGTIERELNGTVPAERASDMRDAVFRAFEAAAAGDAVLLAPACASFDMFKSFEHRGMAFKEAVRDLGARIPSVNPGGT